MEKLKSTHTRSELFMQNSKPIDKNLKRIKFENSISTLRE
jgi:hypothetical protein